MVKSYKEIINIRFFITMLICAVILSPLLAYPIGWDHEIYLKMAKLLLNGGTIYKDFIDLKPPMDYYLFAIIIKFFGSSEFSVRLAEFTLNIVTCISLYYVLSKLKPDSLSKYIAPIAYALMYSSLDFGNNFQAETIVAPVLLFIIYLSVREKQTKASLITIGLLFSVAIAFKYTFAIFFLSWIVCYYYASKPKIKDLLLVAFVIALFSAIIISFSFVGNWAAFTDMTRYLALYSTYSKLTPYLLDFAYGSFSTYFYFRVSFIVLLGMCAALWCRREFHSDNKANSLIIYSSAFILVGLISVFIEKKFFVAHFTRTMVFISVLGSIGLSPIFTDLWRKFNHKISAWALMIFLVLLSPIPQSILNFKAPIFLKKGQMDKYNELFYKNDEFKILNRTEKFDIIGRIKADKSRNSFKTTVFCQSGAAFNRLMGNELYSRFANSQFMLAVGIPSQWKLWAIEELNSSDWAIVNKFMRYSYVYGNSLTNYEAVKADSAYSSILLKQFDLAFETDSYVVFRRK